jgi:D-3-phosphoglycerate dehydrogenase
VWKRGPFSDDALSEIAADFDAMIVGVDKVGENTIRTSKRLKVILVNGRGMDNVNLELAREKGLVVDNLPSTNPWTVAEFTFALLLNLTRRVQIGIRSLKEGKWERQSVVGNDLRGKILGIIGAGNIGEYVTKIAEGFGMKPIYYDVRRREDLEKGMSLQFKDIDELVRISDVITIHVPKTKETVNLISDREFEKMKPNVYVLNLARGGIVNEQALLKALVENKIKGAALDVYEKEPPGRDCPFLSLDNVVATPHMASYTEEDMKEGSMVAAKKLVQLLQNLA